MYSLLVKQILLLIIGHGWTVKKHLLQINCDFLSYGIRSDILTINDFESQNINKHDH